MSAPACRPLQASTCRNRGRDPSSGGSFPGRGTWGRRGLPRSGGYASPRRSLAATSWRLVSVRRGIGVARPIRGAVFVPSRGGGRRMREGGPSACVRPATLVGGDSPVAAIRRAVVWASLCSLQSADPANAPHASKHHPVPSRGGCGPGKCGVRRMGMRGGLPIITLAGRGRQSSFNDSSQGRSFASSSDGRSQSKYGSGNTRA